MREKIKLTGKQWDESDMKYFLQKTGDIIAVEDLADGVFIFKGREWSPDKEGYSIEVQEELIPNLDYILAKIEKDSSSLTNIIAILKTVDYESAVWIVKYLSEKVLK